jgi:hypothetical protein
LCFGRNDPAGAQGKFKRFKEKFKFGTGLRGEFKRFREKFKFEAVQGKSSSSGAVLGKSSSSGQFKRGSSEFNGRV